MLLACGPSIDSIQVSASAENGLALMWQVGHVSVLMAVELDDGSKLLLFAPLTTEAVGNIVDIVVKNLDLGFVDKSFVRILCDFLSILIDLFSVGLEVVLSLSDSLGKLQDFESKGLDSDDLVRVDIDLLLITFLICEG